MNNWVSEVVSAIESVADASAAGLFEVIFGPLIAAFFGAMSAYLLALRQLKQADEGQRASQAFRELRDSISELQSRSIEYWCKDYDRSKIEQIEILEAEIHALLQNTRLLAREIKKISLPRRKKDVLNHRLDRFVSDSYDVITGDEFESTERKASKHKVKQIVDVCVGCRVALGQY